MFVDEALNGVASQISRPKHHITRRAEAIKGTQKIQQTTNHTTVSDNDSKDVQTTSTEATISIYHLI